jgi:hypothetical protein
MSATTDMSQLDAALALAAVGIYVFPVDHPELPMCAGPKSATHDPAACAGPNRGKHPVIKWDTGASISVHNVHHWWSGNPRNVGIHCGKSGLLVVDEDAPDEFARFATDHRVVIPETYTVTTAKGKHYYFRDTENGALSTKEGAFGDYKINIRSGNGYVVGPGSLHETGVVYTADGGTIAPLPPWIPEAIRRGKQASNSTPTAEEVLNSDPFAMPQRFVLPDVIKANHRHGTIVQYAGSLLARGCPLNEAKILIKDAWQRCEQPPDARTYTLELAYADLEDIYTRYQPGRSEGYQTASSNGTPEDQQPSRRIRLTPASLIKPRPVRWAWTDRIPAGELTLTPRPRRRWQVHLPRLGDCPPRSRHLARRPLRHTEAVHHRRDRGLMGAHHRAASDRRWRGHGPGLPG